MDDHIWLSNRYSIHFPHTHYIKKYNIKLSLWTDMSSDQILRFKTSLSDVNFRYLWNTWKWHQNSQFQPKMILCLLMYWLWRSDARLTFMGPCIIIILYYISNKGTRGSAVGWGTALQAGRSRVRFPMVSLKFFINIILPAALWPWGWLSL